jgi:DNA-directed RNA polymerase II subunit RPB1
LLRKYASTFNEKVGTDFPEKQTALAAIISHSGCAFGANLRRCEASYNERDVIRSVREDIDLVPGIGNHISRAAKPLKLPGYSRLYKRYEKKACVGKETLKKYVKLFEAAAAEKGDFEGRAEFEVDLEVLKIAAGADVVWDQIVSLEVLDDPGELVYDLGVEGNHTFMVQSGILTHNTLNSFHFSGIGAKDVTLGVPRLKELLNATKKPSKPSCLVYLKRDVADTDPGLLLTELRKNYTSENAAETDRKSAIIITKVSATIPYLTVGELVKSSEMLYLPKDVGSIKKASSPIGLLTYREYEPRWWVKLFRTLSESDEAGFTPPPHPPQSWVIELELDLEKCYYHNVTAADVAAAIEKNGAGSRGKTLAAVPSPTALSQVEVYVNFSEIKQYAIDRLEPISATPRSLITPENVEYFTTREVASLIIKQAKVQGVVGITKTYVRKDDAKAASVGPEWVIDTRGTNLQVLLGLPSIDTTRTTSDDVWEIYRIFGVEAVRTFLIKEITKVLSFDGTYINPRHISLLVDGMCRTGVITPVNRDGIPREVGPIAKGMFEKAVDNFAYASAFTEFDRVKGVAASVMFGTTAQVGTGTVEIKDADRLPPR